MDRRTDAVRAIENFLPTMSLLTEFRAFDVVVFYKDAAPDGAGIRRTPKGVRKVLECGHAALGGVAAFGSARRIEFCRCGKWVAEER